MSKEDKEIIEQKKSKKVELIISFVALIISAIALIISYSTAYGGADLKVDYDVAGLNNHFFYYNQTLMLEFIVKNDGFSSSVYNIEPIVGCSNCSVTLSFDEEEPFEEIFKPKIKSISAKSSQFVMLIIRNIKPSEVGQTFEVLVRDFLTNKHNYVYFKRLPDNLTELFIKSLYKI